MTRSLSLETVGGKSLTDLPNALTVLAKPTSVYPNKVTLLGNATALLLNFPAILRSPHVKLTDLAAALPNEVAELGCNGPEMNQNE